MTEQVEELINKLEEKQKELKQITQYKNSKNRLDDINKIRLGDLINIDKEEFQSLISERELLTEQIKENKNIENEESIKKEINDCKEKLQKLKIEIDQEINDINDKIINNENNENNDDLIKNSEGYIKYYEDCLEKKSNNMNKNLEEKIKECIETLKEISDLSKDENKKTNNELEELRERKKTYEETLNLINRTLQDIAIKETMMETIKKLGMEPQLEKMKEKFINEQKPQVEPIIEKNEEILENIKNENIKNQEELINHTEEPQSLTKSDDSQELNEQKTDEVIENDSLLSFFRIPASNIENVMTTESLEKALLEASADTENNQLYNPEITYDPKKSQNNFVKTNKSEELTINTIQDTKNDTFDLKEKFNLENYGVIDKKIKNYVGNNLLGEEQKIQPIYSVLEKSDNIFEFIKSIKEEYRDIYDKLKLDETEIQIKKVESLIEKINNMNTNMSQSVIEKIKHYKEIFTDGFNKWLSNPECIIYLQYIYMCINVKITNCPKYKLIDYDLKKIEEEVIDIIKKVRILPSNDNAWKLFITDVSERINEIDDIKSKRSLK